MASRSKSERVYVVIFDGGRRVRFFRDLVLLCECMHLDYDKIGEYLRERGWWCGIDFTVMSGSFETRAKNYGKY